MKKGAIFDMDGLLFDSERAYQVSWRLTAEEHGIDLDPAFAKEIMGSSGQGTRDIVSKYYGTEGEATEEIIHETWEKALAEMDRNLPLKKGAREILEFFKENNVPCVLASSSPRAVIDKYMKKSGLGGYFADFVSGQDVQHGKPSPEIFLKAAEKLGLPPHDCYVFEDSINGVEAGLRAGAFTVMVPDLMQPSEELSRRVSLICESLSEAIEKISN